MAPVAPAAPLSLSFRAGLKGRYGMSVKRLEFEFFASYLRIVFLYIYICIYIYIYIFFFLPIYLIILCSATASNEITLQQIPQTVCQHQGVPTCGVGGAGFGSAGSRGAPHQARPRKTVGFSRNLLEFWMKAALSPRRGRRASVETALGSRSTKLSSLADFRTTWSPTVRVYACIMIIYRHLVLTAGAPPSGEEQTRSEVPTRNAGAAARLSNGTALAHRRGLQKRRHAAHIPHIPHMHCYLLCYLRILPFAIIRKLRSLKLVSGLARKRTPEEAAPALQRTRFYDCACVARAFCSNRSCQSSSQQPQLTPNLTHSLDSTMFSV